jgi:ribonuclease HI
MLAIAGAYRTTATAALNIETYQLPIQWLLEKQMLETLLRIATSRARDHIRNVRGGEAIGRGRIRPDWRCWEWSPLQRIDELAIRRLGQVNFGNLECIQPYITAPYWTPPDVTIDESAEQAIAEHDIIAAHSQTAVAVYTDGSGINGKVGAAAVCPQYLDARATYMGEQSETTVYAAELQGIFLALVIIIRHRICRAVVFTDNQAALRAIQNPGRRSGQYLVDVVIAALDKAREDGLTISFRWIPSHCGVEGNELADKAAKEATGWRQVRGHRGRVKEVMTTATAPRPVQQRLLRSAVETRIRQAANSQWEQDWQTSPHGRAAYELTPGPTKQVLRIYRGLPRPLSTVIVQMRTGKIGLRYYLYQRGVPDIQDGVCHCGRATQTVRHVLLACPLFRDLRQQYLTKPGGGLGGGDVKTILNSPKLAVRAAKFMLQTGLLGQFGAVRQDEIDEAEH